MIEPKPVFGCPDRYEDKFHNIDYANPRSAIGLIRQRFIFALPKLAQAVLNQKLTRVSNYGAKAVANGLEYLLSIRERRDCRHFWTSSERAL